MDETKLNYIGPRPQPHPHPLRTNRQKPACLRCFRFPGYKYFDNGKLNKDGKPEFSIKEYKSIPQND